MTAHTDPRRPCVVLVGPPGAGKSTIGRRLARELGVDLYDTDAGIEEHSGRTIREIFATEGETAFRRLEEQVVRRAIAEHPGVVSLGGGAVLSADTRELLREATVVYLEISVSEGLRRTGATTHRPLLAGDDPGAKYRRLMHERRPLYREVADIRVRTDGRSPGRVVRAIAAKLGVEPVAPPAAPQRPVDGEGGGRRSRRRRRRGRSTTRTGAASDASESTSAATDDPPGSTEPSSPQASPKMAAGQADPVTSETPAKRRARRSRRGGRRRSRATASESRRCDSTPPESPDPSTTTPVAPRPDIDASASALAGSPLAHSTRPKPARPDSPPAGSARSDADPPDTAPSGDRAPNPAPRPDEDTAPASRNRRRRRRTAARASGPPETPGARRAGPTSATESEQQA